MPRAPRPCKKCGDGFTLQHGKQLYCAQCRNKPIYAEEQAFAWRIGDLSTLCGVSSEFGKLYKRVAHGHVSSQDGARQASILAVLRQTLETGTVEQRMQDAVIRLAATKGTPILLKADNNGGTRETT
jgi:hypothetical protein